MAQLLSQIEHVSHALYGIRSATSDQQLYKPNGDGLASGSVEEI